MMEKDKKEFIKWMVIGFVVGVVATFGFLIIPLLWQLRVF